MRFYNIRDSYIDFLHNYDSTVSYNKCESRPYVGVVLTIGDIKYYAPFTSPKPKHRKMKNSKDFRKIKGGEYGAINLNNMIPVPENALILIDIDNEKNECYKRLLQNQYRAIKSDMKSITNSASKLRNIVLSNDEELSQLDVKIKKRCCDLKVLEKVYSQYQGK